MNIVKFKFAYVFKQRILNKVICNLKKQLIYSSFIWLVSVQQPLCGQAL